MRCKNCGWVNEPGVTHCVKCNASLQGSAVEANNQRPVPPIAENEVPLSGTLREPVAGGGNESSSVGGNVCPKCHYMVSSSMDKCPHCKTPLGKAKAEAATPPKGSGQNMGGTVNPWTMVPKVSLCRIPHENEQVTYEPVNYSGQEIVLKRDNTDQNNNTITSKEQAVISYENGEWYIEDRSEFHTTLLLVKGKMKLGDGDVIVLGNRRFEFRKG